MGWVTLYFVFDGDSLCFFIFYAFLQPRYPLIKGLTEVKVYDVVNDSGKLHLKWTGFLTSMHINHIINSTVVRELCQ
jgi:hypothetical protein